MSRARQRIGEFNPDHNRLPAILQAIGTAGVGLAVIAGAVAAAKGIENPAVYAVDISAMKLGAGAWFVGAIAE